MTTSVAKIFADALNSLDAHPEFWNEPIDSSKVRTFKTLGKLFIPKKIALELHAERVYAPSVACADPHAHCTQVIVPPQSDTGSTVMDCTSSDKMKSENMIETVNYIHLNSHVTQAPTFKFKPVTPTLCFWPIVNFLTPEGAEKFYYEHEHYTMGVKAFSLMKFIHQYSHSELVPAIIKVSPCDLHMDVTRLIPRESAIKFLYSHRSARVAGFREDYARSTLRVYRSFPPHKPAFIGPKNLPAGRTARVGPTATPRRHFVIVDQYCTSFPRPNFKPVIQLYANAAYPMGQIYSVIGKIPPSCVDIAVDTYSTIQPETTFSYVYELIDKRVSKDRQSQLNLSRTTRLVNATISKAKRQLAFETKLKRSGSGELATRESLFNMNFGSATMDSLLDKATAILGEVPTGSVTSLMVDSTELLSNAKDTISKAYTVFDFFSSIVEYLRDIKRDATNALTYLQKIIQKVYSWLGSFFPKDSIVPLILNSLTPKDPLYTFFWITLIAILFWNIIFGGKHVYKLIVIILLIAVPFISHFNILTNITCFIASLTEDQDETPPELLSPNCSFFDAPDELAEREMNLSSDWSRPLVMLVSMVTFICANKLANCTSWMADQTQSTAKFGQAFNNISNGYKNWNAMIDNLVTETVDEWTKFDTTLFGLTGVLAEEVRKDFVRLDEIEHWPNRESLYADPNFHDELLNMSERIRKYSAETDKTRFPARFNERLLKADRLLTTFILESTKRKGQEENFRFDPIHTSFYGEPGVGKSYLVNVMIHDILDFFGKPKLNRIYYRNPAVPFFSGYCGQHAMMIDDANSLKTDLDAIDSLQLKSSVPHQVNMAALADKGRMFTSEFIFSTTNEKLFTNSRDIKSSGAINRRRDFLIEVQKDGDFAPNPTEGKRFILLNPLNGDRISEGMDYFELMMTLLPVYDEMYNNRKASTEAMNACAYKRDWRSIIPKYAGASGITKFNYHDENFRVPAHKCIEMEPELAHREALERSIEKFEVDPEEEAMKWALKICEFRPGYYILMNPNEAEEFLGLSDETHKRIITIYQTYCRMEADAAKLAEIKLQFAKEIQNVNIFTSKISINSKGEFVYPENDTYYKVLYAQMTDMQKFIAYSLCEHKYKYESLGHAKRLGWLEEETEEVAKPFVDMISNATKCTIGAIVGTTLTYGILTLIKGWNSKGQEIPTIKVENKAKKPDSENKVVSEARIRRSLKQPKDPYSDEKINRDPNVKKIVFERSTFDDFSYYFGRGGKVENFSTLIANETRTLSCISGNRYHIAAGDYSIRNYKFSLAFDSIILAKRNFKINKYVYLAEEIRAETDLVKDLQFPQTAELLDNGENKQVRMGSTIYDVEQDFDKKFETARREGTVDPAGWEFGFKKVYNNTGLISNRFGTLHILMIGPNRAILPKHFFYYKKEKMQDGEMVSLRIKDVIYDFKYYEKEVYEHPTKDIACWEIPSSIPHFPSLRKYIGTGEEVVKNVALKGMMMPAFREVSAGKVILHVGHTSNVGPMMTTRKYSIYGFQENESIDDMLYELKGHEYFMNSTPGDCGAAVVGLNPDLTQKLVGIHVAGFHKGDSRGYSVVLCKETLEKIEKPLNDRFWKGNYPHNIAPPPVEKLLDNGTMRAPKFKTEPRNHIQDVGFMRESDCPTIGDRTSIRKSELYGLTGVPSLKQPAVLSDWDTRNTEKVEPLLAGINKYAHDGVNLPKADLNIIADYMGEYIKNIIGKQRKGFGKVSCDVAINGLAYEDYMEGLNMKTSAGWPFCVKIKTKDGKKSLFTVVGEQENGAPLYEMCDELREAVQAKYNAVCTGDKTASLFFECLKDERLKPNKINPVKTRLFSIADVATIIVSRMFMLDFCVAIMSNREKLGPQIGINCDSPQWDIMIRRLFANSPYGFACDYSAFDSTQDGTVLDAACRVMNIVCDTGSRDALARATLFNEMYSRLTIVGNKVVQLRRGLASGVSVTAIVNSIVNEIYLRFAWMNLARQYARDLISQENFDLFVVGVYYGDDNVISVKPEVRHWFNLRTIATFLSKYGIVMTDAKKNKLEDCLEYEGIEELSFLKRDFVQDPDSGYYFAPLEKSSIEDRPQWTKKGLTSVETLDNVASSLRDAFHHGEAYFDDLKQRLRNACELAKIGPFPTITYGSLYQEFLDKRQEGKIISSNVKYDAPRDSDDFATHFATIVNEDPDIVGFQELTDCDLFEVIMKQDKYDVFLKDDRYHLVTLVKKSLRAFQVPHSDKFECIVELPDSGRRIAHCHFPNKDKQKKKYARVNGLLRKNVDLIFGDLYTDGIFVKDVKKVVPNKSYVFDLGSASPDACFFKKDLKVKLLNAQTAFGIDKKGLSDHKYLVYVTNGFPSSG